MDRMMGNPPVVAVVGATGIVGTEILRCLERRRFPVARLVALASARSQTRTVRFRDADLPVGIADAAAFSGVDVALFSAGKAVSLDLAPAAQAAGAVVIDNSSAFRMRPDVPLVVPEINGDRVTTAHRLIANPNCSTAILMLAVAPLHRSFGVQRIVAATYQAASGAGARAMAELLQASATALEGGSHRPECFTHDLSFNLIPWIGSADVDGYTDEERKMEREGAKILGVDRLEVTCTCVRVPVLRAHSIAATLVFERPVAPERARAILAAAGGLRVEDGDQPGSLPTPRSVAERDEVVVTRIRQAFGDPRCLSLFVIGDQLLKGAALNAVQIAEIAVQAAKSGSAP